jgi:hypothetical protein
MRYGLAGIFFLAAVMLLSCENSMVSQPKSQTAVKMTITDEMLDRLIEKRILFGHKSVGYNILEGVEELKRKDSRLDRLSLFEIKPGEAVPYEKPGIYHSPNGKNGFPKDKCDAFKRLLSENDTGAKIDIAFFKFCYVDFNPQSDASMIFDYYVATMESLKNKFPKLNLMHVTVPLVAHRWGVRSIIRNLTEGDAANVKRNEYNKLLISKYGSSDVIYDLAAVESTYPDGKREMFNEEGKKYYSLVRLYTNDGGHLNERGRYNAAKAFLEAICRTEKKSNRRVF